VTIHFGAAPTDNELLCQACNATITSRQAGISIQVTGSSADDVERVLKSAIGLAVPDERTPNDAVEKSDSRDRTGTGKLDHVAASEERVTPATKDLSRDEVVPARWHSTIRNQELSS
jgi:hypothetical protein